MSPLGSRTDQIPVPVIHLLNEKTIEERVWETLQPKKSLFASSDRI
jgi:hypothetical protein